MNIHPEILHQVLFEIDIYCNYLYKLKSLTIHAINIELTHCKTFWNYANMIPAPSTSGILLELLKPNLTQPNPFVVQTNIGSDLLHLLAEIEIYLDYLKRLKSWTLKVAQSNSHNNPGHNPDRLSWETFWKYFSKLPVGAEKAVGILGHLLKPKPAY